MRVPVLRSAGLAAGSVVLALVGTSVAGADPGGPGAPAGPVGHRQVGRWTVATVGPGSYRLTWHSPTLIPTTDAAVQVRHDGSVVAATLGADARTVSVVVSSTTSPDPSTYDVVLGARVLDRRARDASARADRTAYRVPSTRALVGDPGRPGTHAITSTDYRLAPVKLPGIGQRSEMVGHIVTPVDATNASPLVLFLHGRHEPCYRPRGTAPREARFVVGAKVWSCPPGEKPVPSYLGYDYVQRRLASQGYVTVSISADAINALDFRHADGGAEARAALVRDHLRAWVGFAGSSTHPADLSNVVLVGHSRGGEGVNRASLNLPDAEGYRVTGQVLIGPTDFAFQAAPATPTVTLLPYCDGDVSDLQGQNFTDDGRDVTADPTHDLAFHSSVLVMGADHNFFNSEWTPGLSAAPSFDDWGGREDRHLWLPDARPAQRRTTAQGRPDLHRGRRPPVRGRRRLGAADVRREPGGRAVGGQCRRPQPRDRRRARHRPTRHRRLRERRRHGRRTAVQRCFGLRRRHGVSEATQLGAGTALAE